MTKKGRGAKDGKSFWDAEYTDAQHLALSDEPSSDLLAFMRWSDRQKNEIDRVVDKPRVLDIGCGNGRNVIFLQNVAQAQCYGFDISDSAIEQVRAKSSSPDRFIVHSIKEIPYPYENEAFDLVLDMMSSHILNSKERKAMRDEIDRLLVPGGWIFYKTFLLDGDRNAREMISKYPGDEEYSYVHPRIGHLEYVLPQDEIIREIEEQGWEIHKISKSHKHIKNGKVGKRRNVVLYLRKPLGW
ncbi:MAG: class I SAM-dependent methyltransferase [Patescibacteria group bacterium]